MVGERRDEAWTFIAPTSPTPVRLPGTAQPHSSGPEPAAGLALALSRARCRARQGAAALLSPRPAPRRGTELPSPVQPPPPRARPLGSSVFVLRGRTEPSSSSSRDCAARRGGVRRRASPLLFGMQVFGGGGRRGGKKAEMKARVSLIFPSPGREPAPEVRASLSALQPGVQPDTTGPAGDRPPLEWREMPPLLQKTPLRDVSNTARLFPPRAPGNLSVSESWLNFLPPTAGNNELSPS